MNNNHTLTTIAAFTLALFALTTSAQALVMEGSGTVDVSVTTIEKTPVSSKAKTEVESEDGKRSEEVQYELEVHDDGSVEEKLEVERKDGLENAQLHIELRGARGEGKDEVMEVEIEGKGDAGTVSGFESVVKYKAKEDKRLKSVDVKDGKVEVRYEKQAKIFGLLATSLDVRVSADKEGNVTVRYPWYHIFMKKQESSASLQSKIARALAAERKALKEGVASTTIQAEVSAAFSIPDIFTIIADALKNSEGAATVKTETDAGVAN